MKLTNKLNKQLEDIKKSSIIQQSNEAITINNAIEQDKKREIELTEQKARDLANQGYIDEIYSTVQVLDTLWNKKKDDVLFNKKESIHETIEKSTEEKKKIADNILKNNNPTNAKINQAEPKKDNHSKEDKDSKKENKKTRAKELSEREKEKKTILEQFRQDRENFNKNRTLSIDIETKLQNPDIKQESVELTLLFDFISPVSVEMKRVYGHFSGYIPATIPLTLDHIYTTPYDIAREIELDYERYSEIYDFTIPKRYQCLFHSNSNALAVVLIAIGHVIMDDILNKEINFKDFMMFNNGFFDLDLSFCPPIAYIEKMETSFSRFRHNNNIDMTVIKPGFAPPTDWWYFPNRVDYYNANRWELRIYYYDNFWKSYHHSNTLVKGSDEYNQTIEDNNYYKRKLQEVETDEDNIYGISMDSIRAGVLNNVHCFHRSIQLHIYALENWNSLGDEIGRSLHAAFLKEKKLSEENPDILAGLKQVFFSYCRQIDDVITSGIRYIGENILSTTDMNKTSINTGNMLFFFKNKLVSDLVRYYSDRKQKLIFFDEKNVFISIWVEMYWEDFFMPRIVQYISNRAKRNILNQKFVKYVITSIPYEEKNNDTLLIGIVRWMIYLENQGMIEKEFDTLSDDDKLLYVTDKVVKLGYTADLVQSPPRVPVTFLNSLHLFDQLSILNSIDDPNGYYNKTFSKEIEIYNEIMEIMYESKLIKQETLPYKYKIGLEIPESAHVYDILKWYLIEDNNNYLLRCYEIVSHSKAMFLFDRLKDTIDNEEELLGVIRTEVGQILPPHLIDDIPYTQISELHRILNYFQKGREMIASNMINSTKKTPKMININNIDDTNNITDIKKKSPTMINTESVSDSPKWDFNFDMNILNNENEKSTEFTINSDDKTINTNNNDDTMKNVPTTPEINIDTFFEEFIKDDKKPSQEEEKKNLDTTLMNININNNNSSEPKLISIMKTNVDSIPSEYQKSKTVSFKEKKRSKSSVEPKISTKKDDKQISHDKKIDKLQINKKAPAKKDDELDSDSSYRYKTPSEDSESSDEVKFQHIKQIDGKANYKPPKYLEDHQKFSEEIEKKARTIKRPEIDVEKFRIQNEILKQKEVAIEKNKEIVKDLYDPSYYDEKNKLSRNTELPPVVVADSKSIEEVIEKRLAIRQRPNLKSGIREGSTNERMRMYIPGKLKANKKKLKEQNRIVFDINLKDFDVMHDQVIKNIIQANDNEEEMYAYDSAYNEGGSDDDDMSTLNQRRNEKRKKSIGDEIEKDEEDLYYNEHGLRKLGKIIKYGDTTSYEPDVDYQTIPRYTTEDKNDDSDNTSDIGTLIYDNTNTADFNWKDIFDTDFNEQNLNIYLKYLVLNPYEHYDFGVLFLLNSKTFHTIINTNHVAFDPNQPYYTYKNENLDDNANLILKPDHFVESGDTSLGLECAKYTYLYKRFNGVPYVDNQPVYKDDYDNYHGYGGIALQDAPKQSKHVLDLRITDKGVATMMEFYRMMGLGTLRLILQFLRSLYQRIHTTLVQRNYWTEHELDTFMSAYIQNYDFVIGSWIEGLVDCIPGISFANIMALLLNRDIRCWIGDIFTEKINRSQNTNEPIRTPIMLIYNEGVDVGEYPEMIINESTKKLHLNEKGALLKKTKNIVIHWSMAFADPLNLSDDEITRINLKFSSPKFKAFMGGSLVAYEYDIALNGVFNDEVYNKIILERMKDGTNFDVTGEGYNEKSSIFITDDNLVISELEQRKRQGEKNKESHLRNEKERKERLLRLEHQENNNSDKKNHEPVNQKNIEYKKGEQKTIEYKQDDQKTKEISKVTLTNALEPYIVHGYTDSSNNNRRLILPRHNKINLEKTHFTRYILKYPCYVQQNGATEYLTELRVLLEKPKTSGYTILPVNSTPDKKFWQRVSKATLISNDTKQLKIFE